MSQKTKSNESTSKNTLSKSRTGSVENRRIPQLTNASLITLGSHLSYSGKSDMLVQSEKFLSATKSVEESTESRDPSDVSKADPPNIDHDLVQGRLFLQKKGLNNISVWSHVADVLKMILSERPLSVIDYFEDYSRRVKEERLIKDDYLRDVFISPNNLDYANKLLNLIKSVNVADDMEELVLEEGDEGKSESSQMDIMEAAFFFEQAGIGVCREELYLVKVAMKKLIQERNIIKPRFWGKIFGTKQNYYVIECELTNEEIGKRIEEAEAQEAAEAEEAERKAREQEEQLEQMQQKAAEAEKRAWEEQEEAEKQALAAETRSESQTDTLKETEETQRPETQEYTRNVKRISKTSDELKYVPEAVSLEEIPEIPESTEPLEPTEEKENKEEEKKLSEEENKLAEEKKLGEEKTLSEEEKINGESKKQEKITDEEDSLLPPLPPPKKLLTYVIPPIPRSVPKEVITVPTESIGEGVNKKVYFVCNEPGDVWTELPIVSPAQIVASRQIKKYFTGDLDSKVTSYPSFLGREKDYLHAQIARISAATQISPLGFYHFHEEDEEEELVEEEEQEGRTNYVENPAFEPIPLTDIMDTSMSYWVHHTQFILKQGRTTWWSAKKATGGEGEEGEEEEAEPEEEEKEDEEKEIGPPLLTPLSEDIPYEDMPPWSVRKTSQHMTENCAAVAKSNVWPGAYAFVVGKRFENIYIGCGHKYSSQGFSPIGLPHPEYEYELGPEIMEIADPTVETEEAWRLAHKKKPPPPPPEEEEGEEEEEEEEEEEDEDE